MKSLLCYIMAAMLIMTSCVTGDPTGRKDAADVENSQDAVVYPCLEKKYADLEDQLACCEEFLDTYEKELFAFYELFDENRPEYDNFQMKVYQDGRDTRYSICGEEVEMDTLELGDEIQAFCEKFQCQFVYYSVRLYDPDAVPRITIEMPVAEINDSYLVVNLLYGEGLTADNEATYAIQNHPNWFLKIIYDI